MNSQPHYNLEYSAMELSFDLGCNLFIYNVGKYLTRDKGTDVQDAEKAVRLLEAYRGYLPPGVSGGGFSDAWIDQHVQGRLRRFCQQFDRDECAVLMEILRSLYMRDIDKSIHLIKENYIAT